MEVNHLKKQLLKYVNIHNKTSYLADIIIKGRVGKAD